MRLFLLILILAFLSSCNVPSGFNFFNPMKWFENKKPEEKKKLQTQYADVALEVHKLKKVSKEACVGLAINPNVMMKDINRNLRNGGCICPQKTPVIVAEKKPAKEVKIPVVKAEPVVEECDKNHPCYKGVGQQKRRVWLSQNDPSRIYLTGLEILEQKDYYRVPRNMTFGYYAINQCETYYKDIALKKCDPYKYPDGMAIHSISKEATVEQINERYAQYKDHHKIQTMMKIMEKRTALCSGGFYRNKPPHGHKRCKKEVPPPDSKKGQSSIGLCYSYVKIGLQDSGVANRYMEGGKAKNAGIHLKKQGFRNLMDGLKPGEKLTAENAPIGAILVYGPDPRIKDIDPNLYYRDAGHTEVKVAQDKYVSDYSNSISRSAQSPKRRPLIGIYMKDEYIGEAL